MKPSGMTKSERIQHISKLVLDCGEVTHDELSRSLGVSLMTIHRDLEELERQGIVRKIRNGATAQPSSSFESNIEFRMARARQSKERLAAFAASQISPGDIIFLDESTTLLPIVPHLAKITNLTIITNFLPLQRQLVEIDDIRLIGLSGEYQRQFDTFTGALCAQAVSQLRATKYFTSTSAIDARGAYHPDVAIATVKRAMMQVSDKSILLADSTKLDRNALCKIGELDDFEEIIIDAPLPGQMTEQLGHAAKIFTVIPEQISTDNEGQS